MLLPAGIRIVVMSGLKDRLVCQPCGARCIRDNKSDAKRFLARHPVKCQERENTHAISLARWRNT
jgi:hypothetical protein